LGKDYWPADQVERRPVAALVPCARNARTHTDEQVAQIAASIREWGWRAYIIADNQIPLNAGWGLAKVKIELADLDVAGFDLDLVGFGDALEGLLADQTDGLTDPDEAPPLPEHPVSETGDVWLLGRHRLVCGDATEADAVANCLNGVAPHLMVTDPPYGVGYEPA